MFPVTPFMILVLSGFAVFMGVLGNTWLRQFVGR